jgi:hypothetical protein
MNNEHCAILRTNIRELERVETILRFLSLEKIQGLIHAAKNDPGTVTVVQTIPREAVVILPGSAETVMEVI